MRGDGRVFKRGPVWWIAYSSNGQESRESSRSPRRSEARMLLTQRLAQRDQGTLPSAGSRTVRLSTLLEALVTDLALRNVASLRHIQSHLAHVTAFCGTMRAQDVTETVIDRFVQAQRAAGAAPASVNRRTGLLGQALKLGYRRQQVLRVPHIRRLPVDNVREGFFEAADLDRLLPHLPPYLQDITRFGYYTGWRKGEILSLEWRDVDLKAGTVRLRSAQSKTRRGRQIPLHGPLRRVIDHRATQRTVGDRLVPYVFHREGRRVRDIDTAWKTATRKAGIPYRLFHDLRRTAVRNMVQAGIPERVAMAISGHATRSMFDRYHIVSDADLREAMRRLEAFASGQLLYMQKESDEDAG
jgi:integrase